MASWFGRWSAGQRGPTEAAVWLFGWLRQTGKAARTMDSVNIV